MATRGVSGGSWCSDFSESINVKGFFCSPVSHEDGSVGVRVDALYNQSMEITFVDATSGEKKVSHRDCGLCISHTEYSAADLRSGIGSLTCKKQDEIRNRQDAGVSLLIKELFGEGSYEEFRDRIAEIWPHGFRLDKIFGALLYISSRNADIKTVYESSALRVGKNLAI